MNSLDDHLGYDADHDDPRQYCRHGTFIGSWWGPDYLCWACEDGISDREFVLSDAGRDVRRCKEQLDSVGCPTDEQIAALMAVVHDTAWRKRWTVVHYYCELVARRGDNVIYWRRRLRRARLRLLMLQRLPHDHPCFDLPRRHR